MSDYKGKDPFGGDDGGSGNGPGNYSSSGSSDDSGSKVCEAVITDVLNSLPFKIWIYLPGSTSGNAFGPNSSCTPFPIKIPHLPKQTEEIQHIRVKWTDEKKTNHAIWVWNNADCKMMFSRDGRKSHHQPCEMVPKKNPDKNTMLVEYEVQDGRQVQPWIVGELETPEEIFPKPGPDTIEPKA